MIIDCDICAARPTACADCVVSVVLGSHPHGLTLDESEQTAVAVLAGSGLVPPLRLTPAVDPMPVTGADPPGESGPRRQTNWSRRQRAG